MQKAQKPLLPPLNLLLFLIASWPRDIVDWMERTRQRQMPSELVAFCFSGALPQGERKGRGCMGGAQVSPGCLAAHVQGVAKPPLSSCPPYPAFSGRIPVFLFLWGKEERGVEPKRQSVRESVRWLCCLA